MSDPQTPERTDSEVARQKQAQRRFHEGVDARRAAIEDAKPRIHRERALKRDPNFTLKVFESAVDWVVAKDLDDVLAVLADHYGAPYCRVIGLSPAEARDELTVCDPDVPLALHQEEWSYRTPERGKMYTQQWPIIYGNYGEAPDEDTGMETCYTVVEIAPMWWWAQHQGRGFLGSTEF